MKHSNVNRCVIFLKTRKHGEGRTLQNLVFVMKLLQEIWKEDLHVENHVCLHFSSVLAFT